MGNLYVNHTACGQNLPAVLQLLRGGEAYVSRPGNGCFVVFDRASEVQGEPAIVCLGSKLSSVKDTRVLSVLIAEDDVIMFWLFENGKLDDIYNSNPDYAEVVDVPKSPTGGNVDKLCAAFGCEQSKEIDDILHNHSALCYIYETNRHRALVGALKLPQEAVATGFGYIAMGEFPEGFGALNFNDVPK